MKLRVLRSAVFLIVLLAAAVNAGQKEKRRPDLYAPDARSISGVSSSAAGSWIVPDAPQQIENASSASSLDAFHRNTLPLTVADQYVYMVTKKGGNVYAIGEDGFIARATNAGLTAWTMANSGIGSDEDVYAIEGSGTGVLLAGTSLGKIYRSTNSGVSWALVYWNPAEVDFINYIKSTDNGAGFIAVGDAATSGIPMAFISTSNSGTSWINLNTNITGATHPNGVRFNGATGFLTGTATLSGKQYRGIFRTTNSGSTWQFYTVGNTSADSLVSIAAIDFSAALGRGLAVRADSTLWKTTNNGATWRKVASLPRIGFSIAFVPGTTYAYVVGRNGLIANVDTQNDMVNAVLTDDQQLFSQVQFASSTEGYLNDDLARRRYYSTINATGSSISAPIQGVANLLPNNSAELAWSAVTGATAYDVELGANVSALYRATVKSTSLRTMTADGLAPNTTYYWRVRGRNTLTTGTWQTYSVFTTNAVSTISNVRSAQFPSKPSASTDYRLVYVPSASGKQLGSLVSGSSPNDFRAFRDNAGTPPSHLDEINAGNFVDYQEGFWLVKRDDFILNTTLDHPPIASGEVELNMKIGWNIIGNPFSVPVKWSDVLAANGLTPGTPGGVLYGYFGAAGFAPVDEMKPFTGYYLYSSSFFLGIPYPFSSTAEVSAPEPSMSLGITYRSAMNQDRTTVIGVDPSASIEMDLFDLRKPPVFGDQGAVWFERPEWDAKHSRFAGDFRPSLGDGQVWNFTVQHPQDAPATLALEHQQRIPAGYEAVFINAANGMLLSPDEKGEVIIGSRETSGSYSLVIGKREFIRNNIPAAVPQEFALMQNYPNPFNPSTALRFSLAQDANVSIVIYDLLGREVARPIDRPMMSGTYEQNFHAGALASGTYIYALRVSSPETGAVLHTANRKMLLLK